MNKTAHPNRRKRNFRVRPFHIVVGLVVILLVIGTVVVNSLKGWDGSERFTIIFQSEEESLNPGNPVGLLSVEPREGEAVYFSIPGNTMMEVPFGYQSYPIYSIYSLGSLDSKRGGGYLLARSIENSLGTLVDGYWIRKGKSDPSVPQSRDDLIKVKKSYFSFFGLLTNLFSSVTRGYREDVSLSWRDKIRIWNTIRTLRLDQIQYISLSNSGLLSPEQLPDGTTVFQLDRDGFDLKISRYFEDSKIREENYSIEIVNAADEERLASGWARILEHLGLNVIAVTNGKIPDSGRCEISVMQKSLMDSFTVLRLVSALDCKVSLIPDENLRSDLLIRLGKAFIQ